MRNVPFLILLSLVIAGYSICKWEWRMQSGIKCGYTKRVTSKTCDSFLRFKMGLNFRS